MNEIHGPAPANPDEAATGGCASTPPVHPVDAAPMAGGPAPSGGEDAGSAVEESALSARLDERDRQYVRLAADLDNLRRRSAREAAERARYASEEAARTMLPVLDNLRRAVDHTPADTPASLLEGLHYVVRQFEEALGTLAVTPIDAVGQPFDPAQHEAVGGEPSPDVAVDTVIAELQRGYRIHDRVLRPAVVRIAHPAAGPAAATRHPAHRHGADGDGAGPLAGDGAPGAAADS